MLCVSQYQENVDRLLHKANHIRALRQPCGSILKHVGDPAGRRSFFCRIVILATVLQFHGRAMKQSKFLTGSVEMNE
jgi:hypothetical protein